MFVVKFGSMAGKASLTSWIHGLTYRVLQLARSIFFFKQKTAYEIGLGIPAEPLFRSYIPKTSAFTLAFSTSQRLRTTRASARTFFTFRHYITPSARNF